MPVSVFQKYQRQNYPHVWEGEIVLQDIVGSEPADKKTLEWHIRSRAAENVLDAEVALLVDTIMAERPDLDEGQAISEAASQFVQERSLVRFRRDGEQGLWIPGNNLKACIKEAVMIAVNSGRLPGGQTWGKTNKGAKAWFPEHLFVVEDRLFLGRQDADSEEHWFVHANRGGKQISAITYAEVCRDVPLSFTVEADWNISDDHWAAIWTTAERIGLGATRARGFGQFDVTKWNKLPVDGKKRKAR